MNCLKKMVSDSLVLVFDSLTILLSGPLPDTVVDVNQKRISLPLDKVFTDLTRHGFVLSSQSHDPEKATVFTDDGQPICWPHQLGETAVSVTALDTFTGISGKQNALLLSGNLSTGRTFFRLSEDAYPPGVYIVTWKEGSQNLFCKKILIVP